jgi:hypothetical protein
MTKIMDPFVEAGHQPDQKGHYCVRCGDPMIDIYEDAAYGPVRKCIEKSCD